MDEIKQGASAETPNSQGTENRAAMHANYNPNGPQQLARIIAGEQIEDAETLPEPWGSLAQTIMAQRNERSAGGTSAVDVFEELIAQRQDANELRAAVLSARIDEEQDEPADETYDLFNVCPELPPFARIPEHLANDLTDTGRWLNEYIAFSSLASPMSPPSFHLVLGLTLLSTAIARRVYTTMSNEVLYPNIYALIVAHSTLYAKTTAFEIARKVLQLADLGHLMLPVGITPQSLIGELTTRQPDTFSTWDLADQLDWRSERKFAAQRVWLMDEAAGLLDAFDQKYLAELLNLVLKFYECPDKLGPASTIARGRQTVRNVYLTICGPTTPSAMRPHLSNRSHWGNGLFARFAFITPDAPPRRVFYPRQMSIPSRLTTALRNLALERLPMPEEDSQESIKPANELFAQLAPGVWESWDTYHKGLWDLMYRRIVPEKFYPNYGRLHTLCMKIAIQLATIDWAEVPASETIVITMKHWAKAQLITEEFRASLHRMIADASRVSEEDNLEQRILRFLRQAPRGLSAREVANSLNMTEPAKREILERQLDRMRRDGLIELVERKAKRGPGANAWVLVGLNA